MSADTLFSVLTPSGRGAVAVVAVTGPDAVAAVDKFFHAKNHRSLGEQPLNRIVYGKWGDEDLVVSRRGSDSIEVHCHGGSQSVAVIAGDLRNSHCTEITWQEWLARSAGCPLRAAASIALAEAASVRTASILLDQLHGALRDELQAIISLLRTKHEPPGLPCTDGGLASGDCVIEAQSDLPEASAFDSKARARLQALLGTAQLGLHLTRPWEVAIAGRPNVGKSSLINALLGYDRAIVFDQPGTTRDVVTASTVIDGWPVVLSDTAGLHATMDALESAGIELARRRLAEADLVVWALDGTQVKTDHHAEMNRQVNELGLEIRTRHMVVVNKIDQTPSATIPDEAIGTCAISGAGIKQLLAAISNTLVPNVSPRGTAVLFTPGQESAVSAALKMCQRGHAGQAAESLANLIGC